MPRFVPATVHELSRVELLSGLSGEQLTVIAKRMRREEVPPGHQVVREGDHAERFYVVLSGIFAVSQEDLGPRRVLQPGGYFGEASTGAVGEPGAGASTWGGGLAAQS